MSDTPRSLHLLLIDDTPSDRELARIAISKEYPALRAVEITNPDELEEALNVGGFEAVVTDYALGWSNGIDVLNRIKARYPDVPVVMFTSSGSEEIAVTAMKQGLDDYVVKSPRQIHRLTMALAGSIARTAMRLRAERAEAELLATVSKQQKFVRDVLFSVTDGKLRLCGDVSDLPESLPEVSGPFPLSRGALRALRVAAETVAREQQFEEGRWQDLQTAIGEAGMNAVVHGGGGEGRVCFGVPPGSDAPPYMQIWITDQGTGISMDFVHRATLEKGFTTAGTMGHGFSMILKTCDRIYLFTGPTGTTVVIEQGKEPPQPEWMRDVLL
jgi:DNA-binding NarL/FixJ family response regulator/anti-sigma regulatory factor (Ser/Thr protein kinase)